jgi:hypothetical protein
MADEETKLFFKLLRKNQRLFGKLPGNKLSDEDRETVALYITEIYFRSHHLTEVIEKVSETSVRFSESDLDSLLTNLVELQIEIYTEMVDWIKGLKKPLMTVIDNIDDLGRKEKGTAAAEKGIRSSMRQFNVAVKKIRYSVADNPPKKKGKRDSKGGRR